jgi:hypothetical protein
VRIEDRFYLRYNELNTNDDFDVHCVSEARTGTRLKKRSCRAVYEDRALQEEGQEAAFFRQRIHVPSKGGVGGGSNPTQREVVPGGPPVQAIVTTEIRRPEYRANVRDVVSRNPELQRLLQQRAEVGKRYETLQRKLFGRDKDQAEDAP